MSNSFDIDIVWGGYYASIPKDGGKVSVFRLLDFNQDAYHAALFSQKFATVPNLEEVCRLSPFIGHTPIDARGLVREDALQLIGRKPLTRDDLDGYMYYLEAHGITEDKQNELMERLITFSNEPPLALRLEIVDEALLILERK